jgi:hypothetical protein
MSVIPDEPPACCGNCRFYLPIDPHADPDDLEVSGDHKPGEIGRCTRYPPQFFYPKLLNAEFPVVAESILCGEFKMHPELDGVL